MVEGVKEALIFWIIGIMIGYWTATFFPSGKVYPLSTIITIAILLFIIQLGLFFKLWITK